MNEIEDVKLESVVRTVQELIDEFGAQVGALELRRCQIKGPGRIRAAQSVALSGNMFLGGTFKKGDPELVCESLTAERNEFSIQLHAGE